MTIQSAETQLRLNDAYQAVVRLLNARQYTDVLKIFEKLPRSSIGESPLWMNALGVAYRGANRPMSAIGAYLRALRLDKTNSGTWSNLGNAYKDANLIKLAIAAHKESIVRTSAPSASQWHNYGLALSIAGLHDEAIVAFESALLIDPSQVGMRWDLARSQLYLKNYKAGFENYKYRWAMKDAPPRRVIGREWNGEVLDKATKLFVYVEQGFGDYIQCARYLSLLKDRAANFVVEVKPELRRLMEASFPDVVFVNFLETNTEVADGVIVSLLDLPGIFLDRLYTGSSGYLTLPTSSAVAVQLPKEASEKNVGIVWSGSTTFKRNHYRATGPEWFVDSFNLPGVRLHSLQMGAMAKRAEKYSEEVLSRRWLSTIQDFSDTAEVLQQLDLVVTTCTSMVHLCGALNVPCWVMLDYSPHWLWGIEDEHTAWYDSLRFFRQGAPGDWRSVFDNAAAALMEWSQA